VQALFGRGPGLRPVALPADEALHHYPNFVGKPEAGINRSGGSLRGLVSGFGGFPGRNGGFSRTIRGMFGGGGGSVHARDCLDDIEVTEPHHPAIKRIVTTSMAMTRLVGSIR
jgi:hypothetical protein